ncbi:MAG TPA: amidohydrolase family protein [Ferruginibacter sp.]|nr:amidohydrolase family protein [Ferruginibacter sp.]
MYRKFQADQVFTGREILGSGNVLITDTSGAITDLVNAGDAGDNIEILHGLLCPGFINCHCHLELSHMKGLIPKHTGLVDFVFKVVNERHFDLQEILAGIGVGENGMLENGIVATGDICNNEFTIPQKKKGRMSYHNFIEASGFPPTVAELRFKRAEDFYNLYAASLPRNSIVPHAPYSVSGEMLKMIDEFPGNSILTIHNQETAAENELFEKGTGDLLRMYEMMGIDISFFKGISKTSLQTWMPYLTKAQSIISVHNVFIAEEDIEFTKQQAENSKLKTFFCLCPNANLYISNVLPDVMMLMRHSCDIVLGTDSLASNDQLSILEEIKTLHKNFPQLQLTDLLQWGTINGARALNMDEKLGSFEKGKKPGLVLIDGVEDLKLSKHSSSKRIL